MLPRYFIDYDRSTGIITRSGELTEGVADHVFAHDSQLIEVDRVADPASEKIDLSTLAIVPKTAAERLPPRSVIDGEIAKLLQASDFTQIPDAPFTDEQRAAWRTYRQALRDLSNEPSVAAMVAAWPARPDGEPPSF